jgi:CxxC-x17-CxxC domain-containing protein
VSEVTCSECGQQTTVPFEPTAGRPVYCNDCFSKRRGSSRGPPRSSGGGDRGFGGPRERFDVTCSECGTPTQVPFRPTEGRPVYCNDCFAKRRPARY